MSTLAAARPARARLGRWPFDDEVVHLVLLDHQMVPTADDIAEWVGVAIGRGARSVRTGAMFPSAVPAFLDAGFHVADVLALLVNGTDTPTTTTGAALAPTDEPIRIRRLRPAMLLEAAEVDRRAFAPPWANDAAALADVMTATPHHRSRSVHVDGRMVAFAISGRADRSGYIQRLAVDPRDRRRGFARLLLDDARRWMQRRDVEQVMVNTAADNAAALALYESIGFTRQPDSLAILELALR